jgi:hypothetical protein
LNWGFLRIDVEVSKKLIKRRHWIVSEPLNLRTFLNHLTIAFDYGIFERDSYDHFRMKFF